MVPSNTVAKLERNTNERTPLIWIKGRNEKPSAILLAQYIHEPAQGSFDDRVYHFHRHGDLRDWLCVAMAHRATEKGQEKTGAFEKQDRVMMPWCRLHPRDRALLWC